MWLDRPAPQMRQRILEVAGGPATPKSREKAPRDDRDDRGQASEQKDR